MLLGASVQASFAQTCTTQQNMSSELYAALSEQALEIATAIKAGDVAKVQAATAVDLLGNFNSTQYLVTTTAPSLAGDTLRVTQLYQLDASKRTPGDTSEADFTCPLSGKTSEVDFGISGLSAGIYAFAMVEAQGGARPWLISILLRKDGAAWRMAGLYTHARTAAGHDGLWYWTTARADAKARQNWLAWLLYGEAASLLRPTNFVATSNLENLLGEQHDALPSEISDGLSPDTPLVLKGADGAEFRFTSISAEGSDDGQRLNLTLHIKVDSVADTARARANNAAAAKAFLDAHKDLRTAFAAVFVFADAPGSSPFPTEQKMSEIP